MEHVDELLKSAMGEIERLLSTKTVVGEPITVEGNTLIPLVSIGFGFGAASGTGKMKSGSASEGIGGGTGGGGGIKPVAVIVVNKDGARVESIKGGASSVLEQVAKTIGKVAQKSGGKESD